MREEFAGKDNMDGLTRVIARGGGTAFFGGVVGKGSALVLHIVMGRVLGTAGYGLYSLGRSVIAVAQFVSGLGMTQGVIRFCSIYRNRGDREGVKGTLLSALWTAGIASLLLAAAIFVFSGPLAGRVFHDPRLAPILRLFSLSLTFGVLTDITAAFAQSFQRIDLQQTILNLVRPLVNLGIAGLAFILGFRLVGAVWGYVGSWIFSACLGFYLLTRLFPLVKTGIKARYATGSLLRFSIPTFFTGLSYLLLTYTDRLMLGYFGNARDVGIYNAATTVSLQIPIFLTAFISIFAPIISGLHDRDKMKEMDALFKTTSRWIFALSLPLILVCLLFSREIMTAFGPGFEAGALVLAVLALAQLVNVGTGPVGMVLKMTGRQDIDFINGIALVVLNIGLNLWLISLYGVRGAALATCLSIALMHVVRLIEVSRILNMSPYDLRYFKPLVAGAGAAAGVFLFNFLVVSQLWVRALTGFLILSLVYILLLFVLGLDEEDKNILGLLKKKILPDKA